VVSADERADSTLDVIFAEVFSCVTSYSRRLSPSFCFSRAHARERDQTLENNQTGCMVNYVARYHRC